MLLCGSVWAQNTPREPMQGGATNPVTQHEADQDSNQKPLSELVKNKKRKPKTTITIEPKKPSSESSPATPVAPVDSATPTLTPDTDKK